MTEKIHRLNEFIYINERAYAKQQTAEKSPSPERADSKIIAKPPSAQFIANAVC